MRKCVSLPSVPGAAVVALCLLQCFCWIVSGIAADGKSMGRPAGTHRNLTPVEFESLRTRTNHVVLDVRTSEEFAAGHLPGAVLMDVKLQGFTNGAVRLDPSKTYLVHCAGGVRSVKACGILAPLGITNLFNLEGGLKAWEKQFGPAGK